MMFKWLSNSEKTQHPPLQELPVQQVRFLCEQDGGIERELKARWIDYFKHNVEVTFACLARVRYGDSPEQKVALCLRADGTERRALVEGVSADFKRLFKANESLDIIFLSAEQQQQLLRVAKPFYEQSVHCG